MLGLEWYSRFFGDIFGVVFLLSRVNFIPPPVNDEPFSYGRGIADLEEGVILLTTLETMFRRHRIWFEGATCLSNDVSQRASLAQWTDYQSARIACGSLIWQGATGVCWILRRRL